MLRYAQLRCATQHERFPRVRTSLTTSRRKKRRLLRAAFRHCRDRSPEDRQVFMMLRPAGRFFTSPRPPGDLAARFLAAVMRPPLVFFISLLLVLYEK